MTAAQDSGPRTAEPLACSAARFTYASKRVRSIARPADGVVVAADAEHHTVSSVGTADASRGVQTGSSATSRGIDLVSPAITASSVAEAATPASMCTVSVPCVTAFTKASAAMPSGSHFSIEVARAAHSRGLIEVSC